MNPLPTVIAIALVSSACSTVVTQQPSPSESSRPSAASSLGMLRTRDRDVLMFASPSGMKVTLRTHDGAVIADRVDLAALRELDPRLYELCRSGVASGAPYLDATLDHRTPAEPSSREFDMPGRHR